MRRLAARACILVLMSSVALHAQTLSKQDATRFQTKLDGIQKNALTPAAKGKTRQTQVTDAEVNAYLKFLAGTLTTQNGVGKFELKSAEISGVTVPKSLVQELLSYYSKSAENPAGINMDDPFQLPAAIREIKVGQGNATIVQ